MIESLLPMVTKLCSLRHTYRLSERVAPLLACVTYATYVTYVTHMEQLTSVTNHLPRELENRAFARGVCRDAPLRLETLHARHVDDHAALRFHHARQHAL